MQGSFPISTKLALVIVCITPQLKIGGSVKAADRRVSKEFECPLREVEDVGTKCRVRFGIR